MVQQRERNYRVLPLFSSFLIKGAARSCEEHRDDGEFLTFFDSKNRIIGMFPLEQIDDYGEANQKETA